MKTNMQQLMKKPYLRRHKGLRPVSLKQPALNIHHDFLSMMATAMFTNIPIIGKRTFPMTAYIDQLFVYIQ